MSEGRRAPLSSALGRRGEIAPALFRAVVEKTVGIEKCRQFLELGRREGRAEVNLGLGAEFRRRRAVAP